MDLALEGGTVIVTGAGSGIGAATARLLGAAGASVVLAGRRETPLRQSADAVEQAGGRALPVPADLADRGSPARITAAALAGIRVTCIAPGPIATPIHATWADDLDEAYRWLKSQVPLGRIGIRPRSRAGSPCCSARCHRS